MVIPQTNCVLSIDIGGSSTKIGILDESQKIQFLRVFPTLGDDAGVFTEKLASTIADVRGAALAEGRRACGIGVAMAGFLNQIRDRMVYNPNLPWLEGYPLCDRLRERFDLPVELEADSNAAAVAEHRLGSGSSSQRFLCVAVGTGVGVGMIVDGIPLRFAYGCLGDIGHIIIQPNGALCSCGGRGCAEAIISAPAVASAYRARSGRATPYGLRDVINDAKAGNSAAREVLDETGELLGIAAASMSSILFPDRIAIAGGLAEAGEFVMRSASSAFQNSAGDLVRSKASLVRATFGSMATLTGAGLLMLDKIEPSRQTASGDH